ncbi:hypothetical protein GG804_19185 [Sphingomonas histidinilytica]|uniref:hypothetical protein n=1 Tax=Rhizorhabdus histidinilytica TaxID=439228 RepID=UPI001ADBD26C|nr:hypothetical protein [Rhizorhabdus histidinilytica]MBO9378895.1 hypothetical protein [Rhizorhabdus histidinilytica]
MSEQVHDHGRVVLHQVDQQGLGLADGDRKWKEPWSVINRVVAGLVPDGDHLILITLLGLGTERVIVVTEDEPIWLNMHLAFAQYLPGARSYSDWVADARGRKGMHVVFKGWPD